MKKPKPKSGRRPSGSENRDSNSRLPGSKARPISSTLRRCSFQLLSVSLVWGYQLQKVIWRSFGEASLFENHSWSHIIIWLLLSSHMPPFLSNSEAQTRESEERERIHGEWNKWLGHGCFFGLFIYWFPLFTYFFLVSVLHGRINLNFPFGSSTPTQF